MRLLLGCLAGTLAARISDAPIFFGSTGRASRGGLEVSSGFPYRNSKPSTERKQMKRHTQSSLLVPIIVASTTLAAVGWGASFQGVGDLPGGATNSHAYAVSADGSTVVGSSVSSNGIEAFRWRGGVMSGLGSLSGSTFGSRADAVSGDGSVVVGRSRSTNIVEPFRWESGSMVGLGIPSGYTSGDARGVSRDGLVVTGDAIRGIQIGDGPTSFGYEAIQAYRWSAGVFTLLGFFPGGYPDSAVEGANANGSVVVGRVVTSNSQSYEACRWDNGVMTMLGFLPGGLRYSEAQAISGNSRVIVGTSSSAFSTLAADVGEACLWEDGVIRALGDLAGGTFESYAWSVSDDGGVVVGRGTSSTGQEAFVWDRTNGMRSLKQVMQELQQDLAGWSLTQARGVSADGTVIVGEGIHNGNPEGWIARMSRNELINGLEMNMTIQVSSVDICWNSKTNKSYQVQYRSDLTANGWVNLGSTVSGTGARMCVTDAVTGEKRFYRVGELP